MRIDFNEPFSLRQLVQTFNKQSPDPSKGSDSLTKRLQHNPSSSSLYGTDIVREEERSLVDNISRHVVYDCANATAVMTTNAVAFLLLTRLDSIQITNCCWTMFSNELLFYVGFVMVLR